MKTLTVEQIEHWENKDIRDLSNAESELELAKKELTRCTRNLAEMVERNECTHPESHIVWRGLMPFCKLCGSDPLI